MRQRVIAGMVGLGLGSGPNHNATFGDFRQIHQVGVDVLSLRHLLIVID